MRTPLTITALALLAGCSSLPDPDPAQAWVDVAAHPDTSVQAVEVDERTWDDPRYFQVQPGQHELTVRYQFAVAPNNLGTGQTPLKRDCQLSLRFKGFDAGERYRLQAGSLGLNPWLKLYDGQDKVVGQGTPAGCQRG